MPNKLTEQDFIDAANTLRCQVASVKAVAEVESKGAAFYADGFPTILFERHKFHKFTNGIYDQSHPEISNPKQGSYGAAGQHQRDKFNLAFSLDKQAAMKSCSWGMFQIMGFNYADCGFDSVDAFVDAMKESEGAQLKAFVNFVIANKLAAALRNKNWKGFAIKYNGADYEENNYDTKLANAYKKHLNDPAAVPTNTVESPDLSDTSTNPTDISANPATDEQLPDNPDVGVNPPVDTPEDTPAATNTTQICKERPSTFVRWFVAAKTAIGSAIAFIGTYFGFDDIKGVLIDKAGQMDAQTFGLILMLVLKMAIVVGAGVFLVWLASKLYDHAANRSNALNMQKLIGAQDETKQTTDFKS